VSNIRFEWIGLKNKVYNDICSVYMYIFFLSAYPIEIGKRDGNYTEENNLVLLVIYIRL